MASKRSLFRPLICRQCLSHRPSPSLRLFSTTTRQPASNDTATASEPASQPTRPIRAPARPIPPPLPFVPDVKTFLTLIGRKCADHTAKIPTWDSLFSMTAAQLRAAGVEPPRQRRYICHQRERFRQGVYGIGGDFKHVLPDGTAHVQLVEVDSEGGRVPRAQLLLPAALRSPGKLALIVNVPADRTVTASELGRGREVRGVAHMKWLPASKRIQGSYVDPVAGTDGRRAVLKVREGLWEQKRGRIVEGGERRRAEVRAKRRAKENREKRDAEAHAAANVGEAGAFST